MKTDKSTKMPIIEQAKNISSCPDWWHVCNAECCRQFTFKGVGKHLTFKNGIFSLKVNLSQDLVHYYTLHGARIAHGRMFVDTRKYKIQTAPAKDLIMFYRDCDALDGCKCKLHGTMLKPEVCSDWDINHPETLTKGGQITPNCLAVYKQKRAPPLKGEDDEKKERL